MGHRELKRVPMDFDWPLNKIWEGYQNPHCPDECNACKGEGYNPETSKLDNDWYSHLSESGRGWQYELTQDEVDALVEGNRLWDFTRQGIHPTAEQVNEWSRRGMGHDSINRWICVETRAKRLGVWGHCEVCGGDGLHYENEQHKADYEGWKPQEPPTGEGYQMWEAVSEGSPQSPVFAIVEELAAWCAENAAVFAGEKTTAEGWLKIFENSAYSLATFEKCNVIPICNVKETP